MDLLNSVLCIVLFVFIVFEGKEAWKGYKICKEAMKEVKQNKTNVTECKDYLGLTITYSIMFLIMVAYGASNFIFKEYVIGIIMIEMSLFCLFFIVECICTRTILFYDTGFLYYGKQYKYRSVLKIEDKKRWMRGYRLKLTSDDEVYVSKKTKPILEEKLKEYKNRKKK